MLPKGENMINKVTLEKLRPLDNRRILIQELEERIASLKDEMSELAFEMISTEQDPNSKKDLANIIYWDFEKHIQAKTVALGCGCNHISHILKSVISPYEVVMSCSDCKKDYTHKYTSRSSKVGGTYPLCDSCIENREIESSKWINLTKKRIEHKLLDINTLRLMPYSEYLQTDHWKDTRRKAQKRANYRCQLCNTNKQTLHTHHRTYERKGQEYASDLIVLCSSCHETFHNHSELKND